MSDQKQAFSEHQSQIQGYRVLTAEEIELINKLKGLGNSMGEIIKSMSGTSFDQRWIAIGQTHLQQGIMALCRAVARPEGF